MLKGLKVGIVRKLYLINLFDLLLKTFCLFSNFTFESNIVWFWKWRFLKIWLLLKIWRYWKYGVLNFWRFSKIWLFWKIWQPLTIWLHLTTLAFLILAFLEELGDFVLGRLCFGEILSAGRFCTGGIMGVNLIFFHPVAKSLLIDSYLIESIPHFLDHLLSCPLIRCPFLSC